MNDLYELDRNRFIRRLIIPILVLFIFFAVFNQKVIDGIVNKEESIYNLENLKDLTGILSIGIPSLVAILGIIKDYFGETIEREIVMPKKSRVFALSKLATGLFSLLIGCLVYIGEYLLYSLMGVFKDIRKFILNNDILDILSGAFFKILVYVIPVFLLTLVLAIFISSKLKLKAELGDMKNSFAYTLSLIITLTLFIILASLNFISSNFGNTGPLSFLPKGLPVFSIIMVLLTYPIMSLSLPNTKYIKREVIEKINDRYEIMSKERALQKRREKI